MSGSAGPSAPDTATATPAPRGALEDLAPAPVMEIPTDCEACGREYIVKIQINVHARLPR